MQLINGREASPKSFFSKLKQKTMLPLQQRLQISWHGSNITLDAAFRICLVPKQHNKPSSR
jgi:hypothetical protein